MNNYSNYWGEPPQTQARILNHLHVTENKSLREIADIFETYPNKIRRQALRLTNLGFPVHLRSHKEAGQVAYKTGRIKHRDGILHTEETKIRIGLSLSKVWKENYTEMQAKSAANLKKDKQKPSVEHKRRRKLLETTVKGSKLERFIYEELRKSGYVVEFHKEHFLKQEKLHLDIFLPTYRRLNLHKKSRRLPPELIDP